MTEPAPLPPRTAEAPSKQTRPGRAAHRAVRLLTARWVPFRRRRLLRAGLAAELGNRPEVLTWIREEVAADRWGVEYVQWLQASANPKGTNPRT